MSKNAYNWEPLTNEDLDALQAFAPDAVEEEHIVKRRIKRTHITNMLRAGVKVPGIRLIDTAAGNGEYLHLNNTAAEHAPLTNGYVQPIETTELPDTKNVG